MSEITQRVRTIFGVHTAGALGGLGRMSAAARQTRTAIRGARSALSSLGMLGAGFGAGAFVRGIVKANSSMEQLRLQITNTIQQADKLGRGGLTGFNSAFAASAQVIERLRKEAIESPAGFQDMVGAFNDVSMGLRAAGASYEQIIKLTGNVGTLDKLSGGQGVVSRDVMQLLRGEIGGIQTSQLKAVRMELQKAYKKGDRKGLLDIITKATDVDPQLRAKLGDSLEGRWESMRDSIGEIARIVGGPLFKSLSEELKRAYEWVTKNRAEVERVAKIWGDRIASAVKTVWKTMLDLGNAASDVVSWASKLNEALGGAPSLVAAMGLSFTGLARNSGFLKIAAVLEMWRQMSGAAGDATFGDTVMSTAAGGLLGGPWGALAGFGVGSTRQLVGALQDQGPGDAKKAGERLGGIVGILARADHAALARQRIGDRYGVSEYVGGGRWRRRTGIDLDPAATATGSGFFGNLSALSGGAEGANLNVDARGSTFRIENKINTDDPSRILSVSLLSAGQALVQRPLSARFGLGSVGLANGGGGG